MIRIGKDGDSRVREVFTPREVDLLIGDASKARRELGWKPKVTFQELVRLMVDADVSVVNRNEHEVFGDTDSAESATSVRS